MGDVLLLNSHSNASIPADGVLISGDGVQCNESTMTGESKVRSGVERSDELVNASIRNFRLCCQIRHLF